MWFAQYLSEEWRPALGCTEPAFIAYAAASASKVLGAPVEWIELECDGRIYKNCYAVGIPNSGHKVGLLWALAIGSQLPSPELQLECFSAVRPEIMPRAEQLVLSGRIKVKVDPNRRRIFIQVRVGGSGRQALARIEEEHTRLVRLELDGQVIFQSASGEKVEGAGFIREQLARLSLRELIELSAQLDRPEREKLRQGVACNLAIAEHGLKLLPENFAVPGRKEATASDPITRASRLVGAGVYARMWGEEFTVYSLAGSGNKGIVTSVPLVLRGEELGKTEAEVERALALACLLTSVATHHLGSLSAVCGCSNAAGIGLAAALVLLEGGDEEQISLALSNMVGNISGMICDGAKIGCALKTMTSVDAAFRAANLALAGVGIPYSDGIVGRDGMESLRNLGRIVSLGMGQVDEQILSIMQEKLR